MLCFQELTAISARVRVSTRNAGRLRRFVPDYLFVRGPSSFAISRGSVAIICAESYGTGCGVTDVNAVKNEREKAGPGDSWRRTE
jgi:hypothetical protein